MSIFKFSLLGTSPIDIADRLKIVIEYINAGDTLGNAWIMRKLDNHYSDNGRLEIEYAFNSKEYDLYCLKYGLFKEGIESLLSFMKEKEMERK